MIQGNSGQLREGAAQGCFGGLITREVEAEGISGAEERGQDLVAPIALKPEAAADHQLDQGFQGPGATLAGPRLLPADARERDNKDLAGDGLSGRQSAIHDAARPQRRPMLVLRIDVAQAEEFG